MAGFHRTRIYTLDDNPWCVTCMNGERVRGTGVFTDGAVVCFAGEVPCEQGCDQYIEKAIDLLAKERI